MDRVKVPLENGSASFPVNVGAGDFTIEFWLRYPPGTNATGPCTGGEDTWINGNIVVDRDIFGTPDYGDFGISLYGGRVAFGVHNGTWGLTICGATTLAPNTWHHVACTRSVTGAMRIFVDGVLDASGNGPTGNVSYRPGRSTSWPNDPFVVFGAEKHDYDPATYPSFNGWLDEVRFSSVVRYVSNFAPPSQPFAPDGATVALYHFDEGGGTVIVDSSGASGGPSNGIRRVGGPNNGPQYDPLIKRF